MLRCFLVFIMTVLPGIAVADESIQWSQAGVLAATEGVEPVFEKLQLAKVKVLHERLWGPTERGKEMDFQSFPAFSLAEFQKNTLQDDEVFLDTYAGKNRSFLFAVTRDQCRLLELPGDEEIQILLTKLNLLISQVDGDQGNLEHLVSKVSELIFGKLIEELQIHKKVIFAPDGIFNLVPVSMLLSEYEQTTFVRVPSALTMMNIRHPETMQAPIEKPRTLAVGGVIASDVADASRAYQELNDLDDRYAGVTVVRPNGGGGAPELDKLKGFDLIHVAAHCIGDDRFPWQSAIALDPNNSAMMIRASEIKKVRLDTRLVVLSSCSLATEGISGEGLQGLTSAFLEAGVPSVMAALWPVDDDARAFFMKAFYEGLSSGNDAAGALAYARGQCHQDPVFHLPRHWGGFVLVGEGQTQMPLTSKSGLGFLWWLGLLAGVGAGVFAVLRIRQ